MADPWTQRQLCDDGACTGVIAGDGRCKVCGRAAQHWGDERRRGLLDDDASDDEAEAEASDEVAARAPDRVVRPRAAGAPDDFERRRLCPDGACVGVLDVDGVCRACGTRATDAGAPQPAGGARSLEAAHDGEDDDPDDGEDDDPDGGEDDDPDDGEDDDPDDEGRLDDDGADPYDDADDDQSDDDDQAEEDDDPALRRELCPDGACVGLIGPSGRCRLCGKAREPKA